jgi:hypothetical protein
MYNDPELALAKAKKILRQQFGPNAAGVSNVIYRLMKASAIPRKDANLLREFITDLRSTYLHAVCAGSERSNSNPDAIRRIMKARIPHLIVGWSIRCNKKVKKSEPIVFSDFLEYLDESVVELTNVWGTLAFDRTEVSGAQDRAKEKKSSNKSASHMTIISKTQKKPMDKSGKGQGNPGQTGHTVPSGSCNYCKTAFHPLYRCSKFIEAAEKWRYIKASKPCFKCMFCVHARQGCCTTLQCRHCQSSDHQTQLNREKAAPQSAEDKSKTGTQVVGGVGARRGGVTSTVY